MRRERYTQNAQNMENYDPFPELNKESKRTFYLLMLGMTFVYADSNLIAPNLTQMAREFKFDNQTRDEKLGGEIAFAFFLLGVPACVLIGILAVVIDLASNYSVDIIIKPQNRKLGCPRWYYYLLTFQL